MEFNGNNGYGGNNNNSRQQNQQRSYVTHSPYRFNNAESKIDPTCLTFGYWKRCLRIGICPKKADSGDVVSFDTDNAIYIYLSHSKARILYEEVRKFMNDSITYNGVGVPTNTGLITLHRGDIYGCDTPVLTIRKLNDTGETIAAFAYQFKSDYYYSIRDYNPNDGSFTKVMDEYKNLELDMFATILDEYVKSMTYAEAYAVSELSIYANNRITDRLEAIMAATGAQLRRQNSNSGAANLFNNASAGSNMMNTDSYGGADDLPY